MIKDSHSICQCVCLQNIGTEDKKKKKKEKKKKRRRRMKMRMKGDEETIQQQGMVALFDI